MIHEYKISETGKAKSRLWERVVTILTDTSFSITNVTDKKAHRKTYVISKSNQYRVIYINGTRYTYLHLMFQHAVPNPQNKKYLVNPSATSIDMSRLYWSNNIPNKVLQLDQLNEPTKVFASTKDLAEYLGKPLSQMSIILKKQNGRIPNLLAQVTVLASQNRESQVKRNKRIQITELSTEIVYEANSTRELSELTKIPRSTIAYQLSDRGVFAKPPSNFSRPQYLP